VEVLADQGVDDFVDEKDYILGLAALDSDCDVGTL